jgi:hypothetical protein
VGTGPEVPIVVIYAGVGAVVARRRVQRAVDRRFNRARYDADKIVTAFAARLQDAVDLNAVQDDLAAIVHGAFEPAHISVWIRPRA